MSSLQFDPINRQRVFETVCDQIRAQLVTGELRPGDKLPAERELALALGVSRPVVREALRALEMAGLLELRKGVRGGAFVRTSAPDTLGQGLRDLVVLGQVQTGDVAALVATALPWVAAQACASATPADVAAVAEALDVLTQARRAQDGARWAQAHAAFFARLGRATGNSVVPHWLAGVASVLDRGPVPLTQRTALLAALKAADAAALAQTMADVLGVGVAVEAAAVQPAAVEATAPSAAPAAKRRAATKSRASAAAAPAAAAPAQPAAAVAAPVPTKAKPKATAKGKTSAAAPAAPAAPKAPASKPAAAAPAAKPAGKAAARRAASAVEAPVASKARRATKAAAAAPVEKKKATPARPASKRAAPARRAKPTSA